MRRNVFLTGLSIFALSILFFSPALGQFPGGFGGKKGGFGGGFPGAGGFGGGAGNPFGGGGFGGGGFGGSGFGGFGGAVNDPMRMFDSLAKGRPFFLVTETRLFRVPLEQFLAQKGITNGQVTRELFTQFSDQTKASMASGPRSIGFSPGGAMFNMSPTMLGGPGMSSMTPGFDPSGGMGPRGRNPLDTVYQFADAEFARRDANGDGVLNLDEMPDAIKNDLAKYDTNRDTLIDISEFRVYFLDRMRGGGDGRQVNPVTIIIDDDIDKRPTVLRAGKLPKELRWFEDLDLDKDGQIALWEWRRAGKDIDEFATYDRNDDHFITPEEALRITSTRNSNGDKGGGPGGGKKSTKGGGGFGGPER